MTAGGYHALAAVRAIVSTTTSYDELFRLTGDGTHAYRYDSSWWLINNANSLTFADRSSGGRGYNGQLDEVAIYSSALAPSQVLGHYTTGAPARIYRDAAVFDGAVGYWRLGETSGTSYADTTGGHTATATGAVTQGVASDGFHFVRYIGGGFDELISGTAPSTTSWTHVLATYV